MRTFTTTDHARLLLAAQDPRATVEEREFLSVMASLAAANEPVENAEYTRASTLAAINMHVEDSIFDRATT